MTTEPERRAEEVEASFARAAARPQRGGLVGQLFAFMAANKKWWLLPILLVLVLVGALGVLGGTSVAPFIYTLF